MVQRLLYYIGRKSTDQRRRRTIGSQSHGSTLRVLCDLVERWTLKSRKRANWIFRDELNIRENHRVKIERKTKTEDYTSHIWIEIIVKEHRREDFPIPKTILKTHTHTHTHACIDIGRDVRLNQNSISCLDL